MSFQDFLKVIPVLYFLSCSDTLLGFAVSSSHLTAFVAVRSVGTCLFLHSGHVFKIPKFRHDF